MLGLSVAFTCGLYIASDEVKSNLNGNRVAECGRFMDKHLEGAVAKIDKGV